MPQPWGLFILFTLAIVVLCVWGGVMTALQALRPPRKYFAWALATGRPKDPSDIGLQFDEIEYSSGQHHALPAWRIQGRATHSNAPIVVMLHGWGRSRWDSLTRVEPFRNTCCEIVLLDLPAHGEHRGVWSAVGVGEPICVLHALQEIAQQSPNRAFILAGHSMGAGIAIRAANLANANNDIDSFASLPAAKKIGDMRAHSPPQTPHDFKANALINAQPNVHLHHGISIAGVIAFAPYSTLRSPIPARLALKNLPAWPFAPIAFLTLRMLGLMDRPLEQDTRQLRAPLLVIAGDRDPISPLVDAQKISDAAPHSTLVVIPYQRHDDLREGNPEKFDNAIAEFLKFITESLAATNGSL
ncbi:MAG: alpha/beta hydrolase [Phycisphaerales bacterium]|nr:alpha/beta hydrolase [Phycisphaerales bacterium]